MELQIKTKYRLMLVLGLFALTLPSADAADYLFNNSTNNEVGGSIGSISAAPGSTIQISLQVNLGSAESTSFVDYWLTQFSGPSAGAFSIVGRDYTGSAFPNPGATNAQVTSTSDTRSNGTGGGGPDGTPDNEINPQNAWDLGSSTSDNSSKTNGVFQIATFTLQIAANAAPGTYQLRTLDYVGFGIGDVTPAHQAAINIVIPEPATWSLMGLGGLGSVGLTWLRARRKK
jgi:hypothetical protein